MNYAQTDAITPALTWLRTLLNSPAVQWNAEQHQAATEAYTKATILLPSSCKLSPYVDVTKDRKTGIRYHNVTDHPRYVRILSPILGALQVLLVNPKGDDAQWSRHSYHEPLEIPPGYSYQVASGYVIEARPDLPPISVWEETR